MRYIKACLSYEQSLLCKKETLECEAETPAVNQHKATDENEIGKLITPLFAT